MTSMKCIIVKDDGNTAVWYCPECARVAKLTFPTYFTFSRWCDHWVREDLVNRYRMIAANDLAVNYDAFEEREEIAERAKHERLRQITEERRDWRFGFA
jgi:hypothetical protein